MPLLLIDTDAFTKLDSANLLEGAIATLGVKMKDCRRLAALPHMLRKGRLHKKLGEAQSARILKKALQVEAAGAPDADTLERLSRLPEVDPGEAQLLGLAATTDVLLLTGDKRALSAIRSDDKLTSALRGKIVILEEVLLRLCDSKGDDAVRASMTQANPDDVVVKVVFSPANKSPREGLKSYIESCRKSVSPLLLWPQGEK